MEPAFSVLDNTALIRFEEEGEGEQLTAIYKVGETGEPSLTQMITHAQSNEMEELFASDDNCYKFIRIRDLGSFLPVRRKLVQYLQNVENKYSTVPNYATFVQDEEEDDRVLTAQGKRLVKRYTSSASWLCTRINLLLALDRIEDRQPVSCMYAKYVAQLDSLVRWMTPKWRGTVWRGALHSPMELFVMASKRTFFIPSFVSTSLSIKDCFFLPYNESQAQSARQLDQTKSRFYQNCLFEIDVSEYPDASAVLLTEDLSDYYAERECLLCPYNVYDWVGYSLVNFKGVSEVPLILLKLRDPRKAGIYSEETKALTSPYYKISRKWCTGKAGYVNREIEPKELNKLFLDLRNMFMYYANRHNKSRRNRDIVISPALVEEEEDLPFFEHAHRDRMEDCPEPDMYTYLLHKKEFEEFVNTRNI